MTQVLESQKVTAEVTTEELELLQKIRENNLQPEEVKQEQKSRLKATRAFLKSKEAQEKLLELHKQNLSTYAIAAILGVSQCAAKKHLNKILGCYTKEQLRRQKYKSEEFRTELIKAYQKDKNISKLTKVFDLSSTTIRKILKSEGLVAVKLEESIKPIEQVETETKAKIEEIAKRNVTFAKPTNIYKKPEATQTVQIIQQPVKKINKYDLSKVEQTQHAITTYVVNAMKECKRGNYEIQEYMNECRSGDFAYLLEVSQEYIDECNMK